MKASNEIIVLGLDPGSRCSGYGIVVETSGQVRLLETGTIRPDLKGDMSKRLGCIFTRVNELVLKYKPQEAAIENVFVAKNPSSALKLGQARGAAMAALAVNGLSVAEYDPTKIKKSLVGVGRADKSQVAFMVGRILNEKPTWAKDASDALAIAICHLNMRRFARIAGL